MIKLQRLPKPDFLTKDKVIELTNEFKINNSCVWDNKTLKEQLMASSCNKCAYCECKLNTESNYMEVEHFEDKKSNPEKVIDWQNLLPSCKRCNSSKSGHNVKLEPIINPYNEDPKQHLSLRFYRLRGKTDLGLMTIDVINLNDSDRLVYSRFKLGEKLQELIEIAIDRFDKYKNQKSTQSKNKLIKIIKEMLSESNPKSSYAACTASILLSDQNFLNLIELMKVEDLWEQQLEQLFIEANSIKLQIT